MIDPDTLARARGGDPGAVERVLASIHDGARRQRKRPARWLWWLAALVGVACATALAFGVLTAPERAATPPPGARLSATPGSDGFGTGLVIGIGCGIACGVAVGVALGRQRGGSAAAGPVHSSRSTP